MICREEAFSPEQVSAMILKHLIGCAVKYLGTDINGAVSRHPHFACCCTTTICKLRLSML